MNFKSGNVVRLKSGGPKMTIVEQAEDSNMFFPKWKCRWYSTGLDGLEDGYKEETFSEHELELIRHTEEDL